MNQQQKQKYDTMMSAANQKLDSMSEEQIEAEYIKLRGYRTSVILYSALAILILAVSCFLGIIDSIRIIADVGFDGLTIATGFQLFLYPLFILCAIAILLALIKHLKHMATLEAIELRRTKKDQK